MGTEFLKAGFHNLGQMAAFILLSNTDSLFDLSFFQATGNSGSEFTGLLASLAEGNVTINHDADRPGRHDGEQNDDSLGGQTHVTPHGAEVKTDLTAALKEHHCKKVELSKKHRIKILLNPVLAG